MLRNELLAKDTTIYGVFPLSQNSEFLQVNSFG